MFRYILACTHSYTAAVSECHKTWAGPYGDGKIWPCEDFLSFGVLWDGTGRRTRKAIILQIIANYL